MSELARACRDCAIGLLATARQWKRMGEPAEVVRLVNNARWYWRRYLRETAR